MASSANYRGDWPYRRLYVLGRDRYTCHWCGGRANTADHVVPIAEGGTHDLANLVAACTSCNSARSMAWVSARGASRRGARRRRTVTTGALAPVARVSGARPTDAAPYTGVQTPVPSPFTDNGGSPP